MGHATAETTGEMIVVMITGRMIIAEIITETIIGGEVAPRAALHRERGETAGIRGTVAEAVADRGVADAIVGMIREADQKERVGEAILAPAAESAAGVAGGGAAAMATAAVGAGAEAAATAAAAAGEEKTALPRTRSLNELRRKQERDRLRQRSLTPRSRRSLHRRAKLWSRRRRRWRNSVG